MLYVTTRVHGDAFTAYRALRESRGPQGGRFVPMQLPHFETDEIAMLEKRSFSQNVADILNLFFGTRISALDLELAIGRYPVKLAGLNNRITVAQAWYNPDYRFERLVRGVQKVICQSEQDDQTPSDWFVLATRIAVLFGVFGLAFSSRAFTGARKVDIAVSGDNLSALMAAWYARQMGLPIGTIICCCNENDSLWNLFHKGEFRMSTPESSACASGCDHAAADLERLIFATLGREEAIRFYETCRSGDTYELDPERIEQLGKGIHVSVVGDKRMASTIPNLYKTTGFLAAPDTALAYSGLTDYRAATGASCQALILSEKSPFFSMDFIARCMNLTPAQLKQLLE